MEDNNTNQSRKVAYTATATAIGLVMIALAAYVPILFILPLVIIAVSWNIVLEKCGAGYGVASMAATIILGFFISLGAGIGVIIVTGIMFVPYSLMVYFMRNIEYKSKGLLVRVIAMAVIATVVMLTLYLLADLIISYIDIIYIINQLFGGNLVFGYIVLNIAAIVMFLLIDYMYLTSKRYIFAKLK